MVNMYNSTNLYATNNLSSEKLEFVVNILKAYPKYSNNSLMELILIGLLELNTRQIHFTKTDIISLINLFTNLYSS